MYSYNLYVHVLHQRNAPGNSRAMGQTLPLGFRIKSQKQYCPGAVCN